jgi:predicted phage-related endonuclease
MFDHTANAVTADRRRFIGGSDARIIMGDDEGALLRLWREKRGEVEPEDLSGNLIVLLGLMTERFNRPSASWVWRPCCRGPCRGSAT